MEVSEAKMLNILEDLRENYFVKSVKLEFEAEGTSLNEAKILADLTKKAGLDLTVKIGGCEALRDIFDAKSLMTKTIIAPMIETDYALLKFTKAVKNAFCETNFSNLMINIETITGVQNFEKIAASENFAPICGVILGRTDLTGSMGISKSEINSKEIFEIAKNISLKMKELDKKFVVGGGICPNSLDFLKNLPYLTEFETRKIVFDSKILSEPSFEKGVLKALEFELIWLKYKQEKSKTNYENDLIRQKWLEAQINCSMKF